LLVEITAVMLVVFYRRLGIHTTRHKISTKPEVHNLSQRRKRRSEPRPHTTCTKMVKIGRVVITRDSIYAIAHICHGNSVRLSVCLSVCHTGGSVKNGWS